MNALDISASALAAQRVRMTVVAANIANAHTTRDAYGKPNPYQRLAVVFGEGGPNGGSGGVHVREVRPDAIPFQWIHDPDHPNAVRDPSSPHNGSVRMPRVNVIEETVDMMVATRNYEANLAAMEATKAMHAAALRIIA